MERPGLTNITGDRCQYLRWKGMFVEAEWDPTIQHSNDRALWCQHSLNCLGPDNKAVDEYECNPARGCYSAL